MARATTSGTGRLLGFLLLLAGLIAPLTRTTARAETTFVPIPIQFIAALGDPQAGSGTGAENWGLWTVDPGPRGVTLDGYGDIAAAGGMTPARWQFDTSDWWLEENGLIMEKPDFPLPPGKYMVTGDRAVTTVLTVHARDADGTHRWELAEGAMLHDVTHLPCRSARYRPAPGSATCTPAKAIRSAFPVTPGAPMPAVEGCIKQDYAVLFVIAVAIEQ